MTDTQWGVRSLRLYYPKTRANIASALEDLLILRGIQVTLVGDPQARDFVADSGRQTPFSFIFDPQRVFKDQPSHSRNRPEAGRYFLYITEELPRKGSGAHDALERIRIHELLRGALCVYTTFIQNIEREITAVKRGEQSPLINEYLTEEERSGCLPESWPS